MTFFIDPDIRKARTLPSDFYTDDAFFAAAKDKVFARTWQLLGGPEIGTGLTPFTLLPRFLDEPVLLVRGGDSSHCLTNVCTHRGKILIEEPCTAGLIRCGYHGRRFSLDGKFVSMPEFDGAEDFPTATDDLHQLPLGEHGGFCFTSIDPAGPLEEFLNGPDVEWPPGLRLTSAREYGVEAHWALYCENYLEGFHIPYVHKALNQIVDYGTYTTETFRYSSLQTGFDDAGMVVGRYLFVFPNLMFNFYPWGISANIVRPVSPSETVVEFLTYVSDESLTAKGAGADLHGVELEDEAVVESVQKGIRSRFYSNGRYSPTREQGTHHFHRLIAEFMG